jgi:hypothetical protein
MYIAHTESLLQSKCSGVVFLRRAGRWSDHNVRVFSSELTLTSDNKYIVKY